MRGGFSVGPHGPFPGSCSLEKSCLPGTPNAVRFLLGKASNGLARFIGSGQTHLGQPTTATAKGTPRRLCTALWSALTDWLAEQRDAKLSTSRIWCSSAVVCTLPPATYQVP